MAGVKKHRNEYTLTRWWVAEAFARAGEDDREWLEEVLDGADGNLYRYKTGKRAINWRKRGIVDTVEERFPGTADIFRGATGQILMNKPQSRKDLDAAIRKLGDPQQTILLHGGFPTSPTPLKRAWTIDNVFSQLEQFPAFNTVQAIVYLLSWADRIHNNDTWNAVCGFYRYMLPRFILYGEIPHKEHVFDALDAIAPYRNFKANSRRDRHLRWRREIPKWKKLRKEAAIERMTYWESTPRFLVGGARPTDCDRPQSPKLWADPNFPEHRGVFDIE